MAPADLWNWPLADGCVHHGVGHRSARAAQLPTAAQGRPAARPGCGVLSVRPNRIKKKVNSLQYANVEQQKYMIGAIHL